MYFKNETHITEVTPQLNNLLMVNKISLEGKGNEVFENLDAESIYYVVEGMKEISASDFDMNIRISQHFTLSR